jgi:tetratricopeptide (TPR) repeat protein
MSTVPLHPSDDTYRQFERLFWAAFHERSDARKDEEAMGPAEHAAAHFCETAGIAYAGPLLKAISLNHKRAYQDTLSLLPSNRDVYPPQLQGLASFLLGHAYLGSKQLEQSHLALTSAINDRWITAKGWVWIAIGDLNVRREEYSEARQAYQQALESIDCQSSGTALVGLGNAYIGLRKFDKALEQFNKALADFGYRWKSNCWLGQGNAYDGMGEYDKAIEAYSKALEDQTFSNRAYVWNGLGVVYARQKEWDRAIEAIGKALEEPTFFPRASALNNLAIAYCQKGEPDEGIQLCHQALREPPSSSQRRAWFTLGNAYGKKRDYDRAVEAYRMAHKDPPSDLAFQISILLGVTSYMAGRMTEARSAFKEIFDTSPEGIAGDELRKVARGYLTLIASRLKPEELTQEDRDLLVLDPSSDSPEARIQQKMRLAGEDQYGKYVIRERSQRDNVMSILRGWSSAVTLLEGADGRWLGGGYFLKWLGIGIVIDPGFDFLRNFHAHGYHAAEFKPLLLAIITLTTMLMYSGLTIYGMSSSNGMLRRTEV